MLPPYYQPTTRQGIIDFFKEIAAGSKLGIMIYDNPLATGVELEPDLIYELAQVDNIVALKDTSDMIHTCQVLAKTRTLDKEFSVFQGYEHTILPAMAVGAQGGFAILMNALPKEYAKLYKLVQENKWQEATDFNMSMAALFTAQEEEPTPDPGNAASSSRPGAGALSRRREGRHEHDGPPRRLRPQAPGRRLRGPQGENARKPPRPGLQRLIPRGRRRDFPCTRRRSMNGRVYTMEREAEAVEAFAVRDGKIAAVGTTEEIRKIPHEETVDLQGRPVLPGFIPPHPHQPPLPACPRGQLPGPDAGRHHPGDRRRGRALQGGRERRAQRHPLGYRGGAGAEDHSGPHRHLRGQEEGRQGRLL